MSTLGKKQLLQQVKREAAEKDRKDFLQGRFAPWAEAQGLPGPMIVRHLMSELRLRPTKLRINKLPYCKVDRWSDPGWTRIFL
jgi:hypothetical protein